MAIEFQQGNPDGYLNAARLRTEDLALAHQRAPAAWTQQIREHFQQLLENQALATVAPPEPDALVLWSVAQGRLVECLAGDGDPILRTVAPQGAASLSKVWGYTNH